MTFLVAIYLISTNAASRSLSIINYLISESSMRPAIQKRCWVPKAISIKPYICLGKAKEHAGVNHSESNFQ